MNRVYYYISVIVGFMTISTVRALQLASRTFLADSVAAASTRSGSTPKKRPPVLFIHGLDSSKHTWRDVNTILQDQGYDSVSVDLRGWGSSSLGE